MNFSRVIQFTSLDPYKNLGMEEFLFTSQEEKPQDERILLLWVDTPVVVIGRSQNPWAEADIQGLQAHNIPIMRRISGGGTVYHDRGNLCYSIITARKDFNRDINSKMLCDMLQELGIPATYTERNDIVVHGKKCSGSAFKLTSTKALHHGTLLINTELDRIRDLLTPHNREYNSKGTPSKGSPVINLSEIVSGLTVDKMVDHICNYVQAPVENIDPNDYIQEITPTIKRMNSWDWTFGKTPRFMFQETVEVYKGLYTSGLHKDKPFNPSSPL